MATETIYNPLIKKGFQELNDTSSEQAAIQELQQKKITKFFSASDSLQPNEIAQYQGDNDAINGLINGYFYKSVAEAIIPKNIVFYRILNNITVNNVSIAAGDYYKIENLPTSVVNDLWLQRWINRYWLYNDRYNTNFVGYTVFDYDTKVFLTVTAQSGSVVTFDNGETADFTAYNGPNQNVIKTSTVDGIELIMSPAIYGVPNNLYITVEYNGKITPIVLEEDTEFQLLRTTEPVYINPHFEQVDTQSGLQNIENDADGDINILSNLKINGNLTVQGTQTTVHTQEIDSESDNINLRVNNPLGLENGEESGVKVLNYDGNNTNCFLGVDNQGWARVGDEGGTLQKLATIEDTPTDGEFVAYNSTSKQLESKAVPETSKTAAGLCPALPNESATTKYLRQDGTWQVPPYPSLATTSADGLMSASDKTKLNGINFTVSTQTFKYGSNIVTCYKYGRIVFVNFSLISSHTVAIGADYQPIGNIYGISHNNGGVANRAMIINGEMSLPNNTGTAEGSVCYISKT